MGKQEELRVTTRPAGPESPAGRKPSRELADLHNQIAAAYQRHSFLGRLGGLIEPAVKPLGWDWRIGCSVLASLPAREIVVATLGVVYGVGKEVDPESAEAAGRLQARLRQATWEGTDRPVFTMPVALSLMVFYALVLQCAATLAVIRRETNSWRWPALRVQLHDGAGLPRRPGDVSDAAYWSGRVELPAVDELCTFRVPHNLGIR